MKLKNLDTARIAQDVNETGFAIAENAIDVEFITRQRDRWMTYFSAKPKTKNFVRGGLIMGEPNFCSYSRIPAWCMYRHFEFLWNENADQEALDIHLSIHETRNRMQGLPPESGLRFNKDGYGVYISTSLYEPQHGMLEAHRDGHGDVAILHYMMPLSFRGKDFSGGGLHVKGWNGEVADIDSMVKPGDLIFFDGRCEHWVKKIERDATDQRGRLAVFAIPTYFRKSAQLGVVKRAWDIRKYETASKLKSMFSRRERYPSTNM